MSELNTIHVIPEIPVYNEYAWVKVRRDGISLLAIRGVSKEMWPERLVIVPELPRGSGGKVAKKQLREETARQVAAERHGFAEDAALGKDSTDPIRRRP